LALLLPFLMFLYLAMNWMTSGEDLQWWVALLWWVTRAAVRDMGSERHGLPHGPVAYSSHSCWRAVLGEVRAWKIGWINVWWLANFILWVMWWDRRVQRVYMEHEWSMFGQRCVSCWWCSACAKLNILDLWTNGHIVVKDYLCAYMPPTIVNLVMLVVVGWYVCMCPTVEIGKFRP
jgi:hypothetical protein